MPSTKDYYDAFSGWYERERHHGYHALVDRLESELACRYGDAGRVLEVGCGTGLILERVRRVAKSAHGLDLSRGMLGHARKKGLSIVQGSVVDLPFPTAHFDLVYSFKVLAHVQPIERALAELGRVTRPGGHLLLEFYNERSLRYLVRRLRPSLKVSETVREDAVYTRFDTIDTIKSRLPAGIEVLDVRGVRVLTPVPHAFKIPLLGAALAKLESWAADAAPWKHFGGFLIVIARKRG